MLDLEGSATRNTQARTQLQYAQQLDANAERRRARRNARAAARAPGSGTRVHDDQDVS